MFKSQLLAQLLQRCTFPSKTTPVTCAVSGGPDSMALLVLAIAAGCEVTAMHVDHGLRPGSEDEAEIVQDAAMRFGAKFESRVVHVGHGSNLEARARAARYAVFPADVLTGHTADDQAETVLMNLLRGAGLDGLAGMRQENHPIIRLRRAETHMLCAALGLDVVHDPSNEDQTIMRNRVRHSVIPILSESAHRDIVAVIARQTDQLRADADYLNNLATALDPTDALAIASAPEVLARRAIRSWLRLHLDDELHPPGSASVERVLMVARGEAKACEVEGGLRISRTAQRLRIATLEDEKSVSDPCSSYARRIL